MKGGRQIRIRYLCKCLSGKVAACRDVGAAADNAHIVRMRNDSTKVYACLWFPVASAQLAAKQA